MLKVVYLLIPTSNHNQNLGNKEHNKVVYLLIPTSNHNLERLLLIFEWVVYLLIPTSNHNCNVKDNGNNKVVYLLIPTSNHNAQKGLMESQTLYIFWFLHQTTTTIFMPMLLHCCISFDSYIKPQLSLCYIWTCWGCISFDSYIKPQLNDIKVVMCYVVYLLIPTSNHNSILDLENSNLLYIFWFLHQTTTYTTFGLLLLCCISFDSYIKPQLGLCCHFSSFCCISFDSYIKPQPTDLNILIFSA